MQQLEIKYFFPLTEQIPLDLDYRRSIQYEEDKKRHQMFISDGLIYNISTIGMNGASTIQLRESNITSSFTIDIDSIPITVTSKEKPNLIKRWLYSALGVKWKSK